MKINKKMIYDVHTFLQKQCVPAIKIKTVKDLKKAAKMGGQWKIGDEYYVLESQRTVKFIKNIKRLVNEE